MRFVCFMNGFEHAQSRNERLALTFGFILRKYVIYV